MKTLLAFILSMVPAVALAGNELIVHEWGTFTALQNEQGEAIAGINGDDERLPPFVHRLDYGDGSAAYGGKGVGYPYHPDVTLRLETPVVYFYPADGKPIRASLKVKFKGGLLTEFYPNANVTPAASTNLFPPRLPISAKSTGLLEWPDLAVGGDKPGPETAFPVWLAPRKVRASSVQTPAGEQERYLFYRGVGHLDAPIKVVRDGEKLRLHAQLDADFPTDSPMSIKHLWLADFAPEGKTAYRSLDPVSLEKGAKEPMTSTAAQFDPKEYSAEKLAELRKEMRAALVADGLFEDEADALLKTWESSYFKSGGLRLFFLVPRAWTDHYLPLEINPAAAIERSMVGRIELMTPAMRQSVQSLPGLAEPQEQEQFLKLGRFARAILIDDWRRNPTDAKRVVLVRHNIGQYAVQGR